MNLSRLAVKRPIATSAILIVILVIGLMSLWQSPLDLLPEIDPPVLAVITVFPGSAPQETMNLVTEPVEDMASTISGLTGIHSISQESVSIVVLQFSWGTDVGALREDISSQLDLVTFPEGVMDSIILEFDPTLMPIMQIAMSGTKDLASLTYEAENRIVPRLETVPGVASVNVHGGINEDLFVRLSPRIVEEKNMSFEMISNILRASLMDIPAGIRDIDNRSMRLRFVGRSPDPETVKDLVVGFDLDEEALKELVGKQINIDLREQLASFEPTDDISTIDIPMRDVYLRDFLEDIEIDRENNLLILTFPVEEHGQSETIAYLLDLLAESISFNGNIGDIFDGWDDYSNRDQFINGRELPDDFDFPGEFDFPDDYEWPDWYEFTEGEAPPGDDDNDCDNDNDNGNHIPNIIPPRLPEYEEPGRLIIPLPDELEHDITEEEIGSIVIYSTPDFEKWTAEIEKNITGELDKASDQLNESVTELALAYIMSQAGMGGGGGALDMLGEEDSFPIIPVTLGSIADVEIAPHPASNITRINSQPSISLSLQKEGDANTVTVARNVRSVMNEITEDYTAGENEIFFYYPLDQGREIEIALMDLAWALIGGAFLAITVLLIFLKNWRTTLIIGLSIPAAIVFTFSILYFTDMTINLMTLGGLALAAGMLVDNAIVVSENIYRHFQMGKSPPDASIEGANEVTAAITASTLTTLSVFFPVVFLTGIAGELFWEFAVTVSCALFASLIIALTVIPMLASLFLRIKMDEENKSTRLPVYRFALNKALKYRWIVITAGVLFLILGISVYSVLGMDLFPIPEESSFSVDITLPPGTTLSSTDEYIKELEEILKNHKDKFRFYSSRAGDPGFFGMAVFTGGTNQGRIRVRLEDEYVGEMDAIISEIREEALRISDEAELSFNRETILDASGLEVALELDVVGDSVERVGELSSEVVKKMAEIEFFSDVKSLMDEDRPEIHIQVNQQKALEKGITTAQSALRIREALEGVAVARIQTEERILDLVLGYREEELSTMEDVKNLGIFTEMGNYIKLKEVADITESFGPLSIPRKDRQTIGQVQANFHGIDLDSAMKEALAAIEDIEMPEGYSVEPTGTFELMEDAFGELGLVLLIAALLVYLVMAAQFESILHPFIIICSLPLAFTGAMLALLFTGNSLSIPAMIGVIVLCGILVNDSIIMIDFINQQRRIHGLPLKKAIIEGAANRLRPILMVTITTILGLTPLAFGIGEGAELQAPMAITIIGGQITGTILLLVVIPAIYYAISKRKSGDEQEQEQE